MTILSPSRDVRGIDHAVLPVADFDRAKDTYKRMGFSLTPDAVHPFGTRNALVQMERSFLEILHVVDPSLIEPAAPGDFGFGAFTQRFLADGEGLNMLAMESPDADEDLERYVAARVGVAKRFDFERDAVQPDGTVAKVAFSLAYAADPELTDMAAFACQNRYPEHFWKPEYQSHANTARDIAEVVVVARDPADLHIFLSAVTGQRAITATSFGIHLETPRGRVSVLTELGFGALFGVAPATRPSGTPFYAGMAIAVGDLDAARAQLAEGGFKVSEHLGQLVVAPHAAHGVAIAFRPGE